MLRAELKKVIFTLSYILFVVMMVGIYITQMVPEFAEPVAKPEPGQEYYGEMEVEIPSVLMPAATESLLGEYLNGFYGAYPIMFYKEVHLKAEDEERMAGILQQLTGLSKEELDAFEDYAAGGYYYSVDGNGNPVVVSQEAMLPEYELNSDISYEEFQKLMKEADEIIGGGSKYAARNLIRNFSRIPMTYEDALEEYEQTVTGETIGKAYTRLFCDYMGVFLPIMTVFVAASFWNMDKRAKVRELIYSREIGTFKLLAVRILTLLIAMLPVILLPFAHMVIRVSAIYSGLSVAWAGAISELLLWLIPEMMFVTLFSIVITEMVSPILAIFLQGAWWYMALSMNELVGGINRWTLILRHNTLGGITIWQNELGIVIWNRVYYLCLSLILTVGLTVLYDLKRKGRMKFGRKDSQRDCCKKPMAVL